jgi:phosphoglycolate phosphatase-like HAD superfamily hydrolase
MARLEVETVNVEMEGTYERGREEGRRFVSIPWVHDQFKEKLGFSPYPGTLNIRLRPEYLKNLRLIRDHLDGGLMILPPKGSGYCMGVCFRAKFEGEEEGALVIPLVKGYYRDVIEILAPVELKERFKLKEGDLVRVDVELPIRRLVGLKAVIFDLDGTILDNVGLFYESFNMALEDFGLEVISLDRLKYDLSLGKNLMEMLSERLPQDLAPKLYERINEIYGRMMKRVNLLKGVERALDHIRSFNLPIGLATGGKVPHKELEGHLERMGLLGYFDAIVTKIDVEKGKPFPDLVRKCADKLRVKEGDFAYVGDAAVDIRSGKAAGAFTISVLTGVGTFEDLVYENPDCIIRDLTDLPERIRA